MRLNNKEEVRSQSKVRRTPPSADRGLSVIPDGANKEVGKYLCVTIFFIRFTVTVWLKSRDDRYSKLFSAQKICMNFTD